MSETKLEGLNIWIPEKVDQELKGEITEINKEGDYGTQYTVKQEGGVETLTPSHKVLQNRLRSLKVGDKVRIVYLGTEDAKIKGYKPTQMYDAFKVD